MGLIGLDMYRIGVQGIPQSRARYLGTVDNDQVGVFRPYNLQSFYLRRIERDTQRQVQYLASGGRRMGWQFDADVLGLAIMKTHGRRQQPGRLPVEREFIRAQREARGAIFQSCYFYGSREVTL